MSTLKLILKNRIKRALTTWMRRVGLSVKSTRMADANDTELNNLFKLALSSRSMTVAADAPPIECMIFSKDRPMQLAALLRSMQEKAAPAFPVHVLYRASTDSYAKAYAESFAGLQMNVVPHAEQEFASDIRQLLAKIAAPKMFFLVDDDLFTEDVDVVSFADVDLSRFVPSLRLGQNLRRCYPTASPMRLPPFVTGENRQPGQLSWRWRDGELDWGYPMSVDGHIFRTEEIRIITEVSRFRAPNSYEDALAHFTPCFADRHGLCFEKSRLVNIPANLVQSEVGNRAASGSPAYFLDRWNAGYIIDYRALYGIANHSAHQFVDFKYISRSM